MYLTSKGSLNNTMERIYAFTDEYGAFGWDIAFPAFMWYSVDEGREQWLRMLVAMGGGNCV